jgi:hypothetical protein
MPHVVTKASAVGSVGDLAAITGELARLGVNIQAIGGGEGIGNQTEIGVVALILDPDDPTTIANVVSALEELDLGGGRHLSNVESLANIEIELVDEVGTLKVAAEALAAAQLNIRSIVMTGFGVERAHVGLGFAEADHDAAELALTNAGVLVLPHHDEEETPAG